MRSTARDMGISLGLRGIFPIVISQRKDLHFFRKRGRDMRAQVHGSFSDRTPGGERKVVLSALQRAAWSAVESLEQRRLFAGVTFASGGTYPVIGSTVSDVNGDSKLDLLSKNGWMLNNGSGTFGAPIPVTDNPTDLTGSKIGDFDGDGRADMVTPEGQNSAFIAFRHGNGNGTFAPRVQVNADGSGLTFQETD